MTRVRLPVIALMLTLGALGTVPAEAAAKRKVPSVAQATALGREAYVYGMPLLSYLRLRQEQTQPPKGSASTARLVNRFRNGTSLVGPLNRVFAAPNVDTLYSFAHLDLGHGPVQLSHPDMGSRYFVFQLVDPYTNTFGYIGTRTTGSAAGRFAITWTRRPGRRHRGVPVIRSRYRRVWVIGRTVTTGDATDLAAARGLMQQYALKQLPAKRAKHGKRKKARAAALVPSGSGFLDRLARGLAQNPPPKRDKPELRRLARVGIGPNRTPETAHLPSAVVAAVEQGVSAEAHDLPIVARQDLQTAARAAPGGWWTPPPDIGDYGTDYDLRARTAVIGPGANTPQEAQYEVALTDATGAPLDGASSYRLTFPASSPPPANGFWSLTAYNARGFLPFTTPDRRYAVGSTHPPLVRRPDGSIVVAIQRRAPLEPGVNWLPAPVGPFQLYLRLYWPQAAALTGAWRPPAIERIP